MPFFPNSALCSKNYPRNINHMPVVIFVACLDLEQKSLFMDGHYLNSLLAIEYLQYSGYTFPRKESGSEIGKLCACLLSLLPISYPLCLSLNPLFIPAQFKGSVKCGINNIPDYFLKPHPLKHGKACGPPGAMAFA